MHERSSKTAKVSSTRPSCMCTQTINVICSVVFSDYKVEDLKRLEDIYNVHAIAKSILEHEDHYDVLGVARNASMKTITKRFQEVIRKVHTGKVPHFVIPLEHCTMIVIRCYDVSVCR